MTKTQNMEEPLELGTVVRDENEVLWLRVWCAEGYWYNTESRVAKPWLFIDGATLVHAGYAPPTPEPTHTDG